MPGSTEYAPSELTRNAEIVSQLLHLGGNPALGVEFVNAFLQLGSLGLQRGIELSEAAAILLHHSEPGMVLHGRIDARWQLAAAGCVFAIMTGTRMHPYTAMRMAEGVVRSGMKLPPGIESLQERPQPCTDVYRLCRMTRLAHHGEAQPSAWTALSVAWRHWAKTYAASRTSLHSLGTAFLMAALDGISHMPRRSLGPNLRTAWVRVMHELCGRWLEGKPGFLAEARGARTARIEQAGVMALTSLL